SWSQSGEDGGLVVGPKSKRPRACRQADRRRGSFGGGWQSKSPGRFGPLVLCLSLVVGSVFSVLPLVVLGVDAKKKKKTTTTTEFHCTARIARISRGNSRRVKH